MIRRSVFALSLIFSSSAWSGDNSINAILRGPASIPNQKKVSFEMATQPNSNHASQINWIVGGEEVSQIKDNDRSDSPRNRWGAKLLAF